MVWTELVSVSREVGNVADWMLNVGVSLQVRNMAKFTVASHICLLLVKICISVNPRFKCGS